MYLNNFGTYMLSNSDLQRSTNWTEALTLYRELLSIFEQTNTMVSKMHNDGTWTGVMHGDQ